MLPIELCENEIIISDDDIVRASQIRQMVTLQGEGKSPDLTKLLDRVAVVAQQVGITFDTEGGIDAAISKQKAVTKTEYIRAFDHLLRQDDIVAFGDFLSRDSISLEYYVEPFDEKLEKPVTPNSAVQRAMAITSSVVLDPIEVSEDDVRKAALAGSRELSGNSV